MAPWTQPWARSDGALHRRPAREERREREREQGGCPAAAERRQRSLGWGWEERGLRGLVSGGVRGYPRRCALSACVRSWAMLSCRGVPQPAMGHPLKSSRLAILLLSGSKKRLSFFKSLVSLLIMASADREGIERTLYSTAYSDHRFRHTRKRTLPCFPMDKGPHHETDPPALEL